MMARLKALWPLNLAGQLIVLTVAGLIAVQIIMHWIFLTEFERRLRERIEDRAVADILEVAHALSVSDPPAHRQILRLASNRFQWFRSGAAPRYALGGRSMDGLARTLKNNLAATGLETADVSFHVVSDPPPRPQWIYRRPDGPRLETARPVIPPETRERSGRPDRPDRTVLVAGIALDNGPAFHAVMRLRMPPAGTGRVTLLMTTVTGVILAVLLIMAARHIARPLRDLADASGKIGTAAEPRVTERGPADVRRAIRAFNAMGERLTRTLDHQRRMIAAVGHDLRTPITALRLRAEFVDDADNRAQMIRILDEMEAVTEGSLNLIRAQTSVEPAVRTDLAALIDSVCADFTDLDRDVACTLAAPLIAVVRPASLTRVLRNLIENALRYGGGAARVAGERRGPGGAVRIVIDDDGPGIDPALIDQVFEPFYRIEASRSAETGGLGLGLSIARSIAERDGGRLDLENRAEGGLRAVLTLADLTPEETSAA